MSSILDRQPMFTGDFAEQAMRNFFTRCAENRVAWGIGARRLTSMDVEVLSALARAYCIVGGEVRWCDVAAVMGSIGDGDLVAHVMHKGGAEYLTTLGVRVRTHCSGGVQLSSAGYSGKNLRPKTIPRLS